MINGLLQGLIGFTSSLTTILLTPITGVINGLFPSASVPLSYVSGFLNYLKQFVPFGISYFGFTSEVLGTILILISALVMIPLGVHGFKLVLRWYNALKL